MNSGTITDAPALLSNVAYYLAEMNSILKKDRVTYYYGEDDKGCHTIQRVDASRNSAVCLISEKNPVQFSRYLSVLSLVLVDGFTSNI